MGFLYLLADIGWLLGGNLSHLPPRAAAVAKAAALLSTALVYLGSAILWSRGPAHGWVVRAAARPAAAVVLGGALVIGLSATLVPGHLLHDESLPDRLPHLLGTLLLLGAVAAVGGVGIGALGRIGWHRGHSEAG